MLLKILQYKSLSLKLFFTHEMLLKSGQIMVQRWCCSYEVQKVVICAQHVLTTGSAVSGLRASTLKKKCIKHF